MAEIRRIEGQILVDYMARDYDSFLRSMRELIPHKLPEWTDYESEADFGNVLLQLFAHMGDVLSYYQDRVANESFLATAQTRRSIIHHLALVGYRLATAAPASAELSLSFPATCTETVVIRRGDAFATKSGKDTPSVRFEYNGEQPVEIECGELAVTGGRKVYTGLSVEEGTLVEGEVLGVSDGSPNQRFPLPHAGIILRSGGGTAVTRDVLVYSELGSIVTEWTLREGLAFSRAGQEDFFVEIDENDGATVIFGDDEFGSAPPAGATIRATYRVGGGIHGNVPAGSIQTIVAAPQLSLLAAKVTNPLPATGGARRESIRHATIHAPAVYRSFRRAVTAADYEALALQFTGVGKVRASATNWNTVTLYVAPAGGGYISDVLRANLLAYFEDLRPLSTVIEIEDVTYVDVFVRADLGVISYYSQEQVARQVQQAAEALLSFEAVKFGQPLYLSKLYEAIEAIDGVAFVTITEFRRSNPPPGEEPGKITIGEHEIPVAAAAYGDGVIVNPSGGY